MSMNYLQELANALGPRVEEAAKGSTFLNFANTMSSPIPYQQGSNPNPWQVALIESLKGFVGGASEAYGKHQIKDDMRQFSQQWANAAGSEDPIAAFKANPELAEYAPQIQLKNQMIKQEAAKAEAERRQKMKDQTFVNPRTRWENNMEIQERLDETPDGRLAWQEVGRRTRQKPSSVTINNSEADAVMLRTIFNDQKEAVAGVDLAQGVLQSLDKFDESEDLTGAMRRGVEAQLFKDSDAADLRRQIQEAAIVSLKPNFPGALSDDEREVMDRIAGGDFGVPIGTLRRIWQRAASRSAQAGNRGINILKDAGMDVPFKPIQDPYAQALQQQAQQRVQTPTQQAGPAAQQNAAPRIRSYTKGGKEFMDILGPEGQLVETVQVVE